MAVIHYVNETGGGAHNGTTFADAFTLREALAFVNALGTLTDCHVLYLCGNFVNFIPGVASPYHLVITKQGTGTFPFIWQGRTADGSADAQILIDNVNTSGGQTINDTSVWHSTQSNLWHFWRNITLDHVDDDSDFSANVYGGWRMDAASNCGWYECKAFDNEQAWLVGAACVLLRCEAGSNPTGGLVPFQASFTEAGGYFECESYTSSGAVPVIDAIYKGMSFTFRCLAYLAAGTGFEVLGEFKVAASCTAYDNDGNHYQANTGTDVSDLVDCLGVLGSATAVNLPGTTNQSHFFFRLGTCLNGAGRSNYIVGLPGMDWLDPMITVDPFVQASAHNFALNNDPNGGLPCQGRTAPLTFLGTNTDTCHDIGAIQTKCPMQQPVSPTALTPMGGWAYEYGGARLIRGGKNRLA